ncbi:MAG: helix-turn-helix domain-containing protein [Lentisphaerae bacterium]|nr:helix-turn-helix domain-containing protein [Lentisphaerota bacterium]
MDGAGSVQATWRELKGHPLIGELCDMAAKVSGISLMAVQATDGKWKQRRLSGDPVKAPEFCRMIQSSRDGGKECQLCHVLMTVAACSGGAVVQQCHSGASALISPASPSGLDSLAIVSSCMFAEEGAWERVRVRGEALGIDLEALRQAYVDLPHVTPAQQEMLLSIMNALGIALNMLLENRELKAQAGTEEPPGGPEVLRAYLKNTEWTQVTADSDDAPKSGVPLLVRVACALVQQRPELPLTVKELSAAAHVTPNYFSTLFHGHIGMPFIEYQTSIRIERAEKLLGDVTLNISDIARQVGYEDPGYFTRRFRQRTGLSPRQWRGKHLAGDGGEAPARVA